MNSIGLILITAHVLKSPAYSKNYQLVQNLKGQLKLVRNERSE